MSNLIDEEKNYKLLSYEPSVSLDLHELKLGEEDYPKVFSLQGFASEGVDQV
ncbi:conserved hypothetical protein [Ricinus communis]|uniref:Uncharacterized protein n=1 Tax=Ricinus communis TaxID=3988 RepID=B9RV02_RICCO|nr:conserved hypothetical protein [Ricinus communis]